MSQALGSLRGRTLEGATLTAVGPGSYTLVARRRRGAALASPRPAGRTTHLGGGLSVAQARYYIACLDLDGRDVLVVGGGRVALEKVEGLLECGAG